jgi:molybdopterin-synthase adenylyltransferase
MNPYDEKNIGIIDAITLRKIKQTRILVVGMGGIGGHLANHLVRLGIKTLHICDHDVFQPSNINRQLFSKTTSIGKLKTDIVSKALHDIRQSVEIVTHKCRIENIDEQIWNNIDIVMDALDSIKTKRYLENVASKHNIPLIHGAIAGWFGQVGIIMPGSGIISRIYEGKDYGLESDLGSPTFTPSIIAGVMISELIKYMKNHENALINKIMLFDLLNHDYQILFFNHISNKNKKEI